MALIKAGQTPQVQDVFSDLVAPTAEDLYYKIQLLVEQGVLSPEEAQAALVQQSEMSNITLDPNLKKAQMEALTALQDIGSGGLTTADKANLSRIQNEENAAARGAREAIMSNMEARGMGGSGMSILAQLQNQQDAATRTSQRNLDVAGIAQQRALEALMQGGTLAGNIRGQDFGEQAQKAAAQDAIAKFNAQNQQQVNLANTAAKNQAEATNLANKQSISNQNASLQTAQNAQKATNRQQQFENELRKKTGQSGVATTNAQISGQNSAAQADADNRTLGTILSVAAMSDERQKEDIEEFDAGAFLDSLTSKKFKYKDEQYGKGQQAGIMAQDLLKTPEGSSAVMDTPEGLMVDSRKAANLALSSAADLNKRLKKLEGK